MRLLALMTILFLAACGPAADSETHWGENNDNENHQNATNNINNNQHNSGQNHGGNMGEPDWALGLWMNRNFDNVAVGEEKTHTLTLENNEMNSMGVIYIDDVVFEAEDFSVDPPVEEWPTELDVTEVYEAEVTYAPTSESESIGELSVTWSTDEEPEGVTYAMTLSGNKTCLDVSPNRLIFSDIDVGDTEVLSVEVTNCGGVSSFALTAEIVHGTTFTDQPFSFVDDSEFPDTLVAGDSFEIEVEYAPDEPFEASDDQNILQIETDSSAGSFGVLLQHENDYYYGGCEPTETMNDENGQSGGQNGGEGLNDSNSGDDLNDQNYGTDMNSNSAVNDQEYDCPGDNANNVEEQNDSWNGSMNGSSNGSSGGGDNDDNDGVNGTSWNDDEPGD